MLGGFWKSVLFLNVCIDVRFATFYFHFFSPIIPFALFHCPDLVKQVTKIASRRGLGEVLGALGLPLGGQGHPKRLSKFVVQNICVFQCKVDIERSECERETNSQKKRASLSGKKC